MGLSVHRYRVLRCRATDGSEPAAAHACHTPPHTHVCTLTHVHTHTLPSQNTHTQQRSPVCPLQPPLLGLSPPCSSHVKLQYILKQFCYGFFYSSSIICLSAYTTAILLSMMFFSLTHFPSFSFFFGGGASELEDAN